MRGFVRALAVMLAVFSLAAAFSCRGKEAALPSPEPARTDAPVVTEAQTETPTEEPTPVPTPTPVPCGEYASECMAKAAERMQRAIDHIRENPVLDGSSVHPFVPADKRAELDEGARELYDLMLSCAESFEPASFEADDISVQSALDALLFDHPEIETYFTAEKDSQSEIWRSVFFLPEGKRKEQAEDMDEVKAQVEAFTEVGGLVASMIPEEFSAIDRYRALAYYVSITSRYCYVHGTVPPYATGPYGALVNGYSICQGYAIGFEYLCRRAGLDCRRVRNAYNDDNMHFWDIVTLDSGTYYVDVTWSDGSVDRFTDRGWFAWFMFTADGHHVADDGSGTTGARLPRDTWR